MKTFKTKKFGSNAQGIEITGNPINQEPEEVIIKLPFGEVVISRTTFGAYWVHVNQRVDPITNEKSGKLSKLRIDSENNDGVYMEAISGYHCAVLMKGE